MGRRGGGVERTKRSEERDGEKWPKGEINHTTNFQLIDRSANCIITPV